MTSNACELPHENCYCQCSCYERGREAALSDTLGMLEEIAGRYGISLVQTHDQPALALSVMAITDAAHDGFRYVGPKGEISRAEVEALLEEHPHG